MRRVVLVGGGHSHIQVLEAFAMSPPPDCRLTVVVDRTRAVYSGMVPGFVAGMYGADELEIDVALWAERAGADLVVGRAIRVEPEARRVIVEGREPVSYDLVAFDVGSTVSGLDLPGVREFALSTRPIGEFNRKISEAIDRLRGAGGERPRRVVVAGGGAAGVELAFCLRHRLSKETGRAPEVTILEGGSRILRGSPGGLLRRVRRRAREHAIEIRCDARVRAVEEGSVLLEDGARVEHDILLWATGAASHPLFVDSGLPADDRGFVRVGPTLRIEGHDEMLASGDCAALSPAPAPKAGVYAVRQGPVVTRNLLAMLRGEGLEAYVPQRNFLALLNLGDGVAAGAKWGVAFQGRWVMALKDRIDRAFMARFQVDTGGR